jgi:ribokinase
MSGRIVVVGSANADLVMKLERLPGRGETVTGGVFQQVFGGKGANAAVGAARAGGNVSFVGCMGRDGFADSMIDGFRADGIDTTFVYRDDDVATGTALILVDAEGQNSIAVAPGANYRLAPRHVDEAGAVLDEAALVLLQCEIAPETLEHVVRRAASAGRPVLLNLAPARALPDAVLGALSYLAVNEREAEFLTGLAVENENDVQRAADALLARGPRTVILTLGARGAFVAGADGGAFIPGFVVQAVDSTAAGDIHCGSLAVALVEGRPLVEAVRFANAASALSVTRFGAQPSTPKREEIDAFLRTRG